MRCAAVIQRTSQQFHHPDQTPDRSNLKKNGYILAYGFRGLKFIGFVCSGLGSEHHSSGKHVAVATNFIVDWKERDRKPRRGKGPDIAFKGIPP